MNSSAAVGFYRSRTDSDAIIRFRYANMDTSSNNYYLRVWLREDSSTGNKVDLRFYPDKAQVLQLVGSWTTLDTDTGATSTQGTWYDVVAKIDGSNVKVWRGEVGGSMDLILESTGATMTTTTRFWFYVATSAQYRIDNVGIEDTSHTSTHSFAYDSANEQTSMVSGGVTTSFTFDDWGRTITKSQGSYTAAHQYLYGNKLRSVTSNFPNEPATQYYDYDGLGRMRSNDNGSGTTLWKYRWAGNQMINEYNDTDGTAEIENADLIYTYAFDPNAVASVPVADLAGTNPSNGTARYYFGDNLGSTRRLRDASKASLGQYEYQPYGEVYSQTGAQPRFQFAGMYYESNRATYYTLNRFYNPTLARWSTRDPLGMVDGPNVYAYVNGRCISHVDSLGLFDAGPFGGTCCNTSTVAQWACVGKKKWKKLEPGECTGSFTDCDGMTCGGGFYKIRNFENGDCHTSGKDCPRSVKRRWTPEASGPNAESPHDRCGSDPPGGI